MRMMLLGRLGQAAAVALVVGGLCFALMHALPGDAVLRIAADRYGPDALSHHAAEQVRINLGLDRPWPVQFVEWIWQLAQLDLGRSLVTGAPVVEELKVQLGYSLWLAAAALVLSLLIGPAFGIVCGLHPRSRIDRASLVASVAIRSLPPFVLGLVLVLVFSIWLGVLPPAGFGSWRDIMLPALTLALGLAALSSRVSRDSIEAVSRSPYFSFGRYKGLSDRTVVMRHGLRNAAIPVIAYLGLQSVYLIEGVVVVESIFAYPGIGHALVHAVIARDIPMVQGTALVMGLVFVLLNMAVDAICAMLDPRLRTAR
jgi:ABC-type dipeptide/oligopeptide/nickel transport system permease component